MEKKAVFEVSKMSKTQLAASDNNAIPQKSLYTQKLA